MNPRTASSSGTGRQIRADKWISGFAMFLVVFAYGASFLICGSTLLVGSMLGTRELLGPACRRFASIVTVFFGWLGALVLLPFGIAFFWN